MKEGLLCSVYRADRIGDCTNGGVTAKAASCVLIGAEGPFAPDEETPPLYVKKFYGLVAMPEDIEAAGSGYMFGGNFIYSSDSRFAALFRKLGIERSYPIPVFDRKE